MGVSGLLPLLKSIHKPCSLKKFSGQTIGVDAYGWLHRGTIACAIELAQGKPTTKWLNFVMGRVRMLVHYGIKPYLVFDGDYLPSKSGTEKERAARRRESRKNGLELLRLGKTSQAQLELQKSIDVTPEMARELIEELKSSNIEYIVAPYEADAQLVYLERIGITNGTLSEDSDLLVFGAQCLLTKLDQYGDCIMINRNDFTACQDISLVGWSDSDFRLMAILSGCDYLSSIDKMGLKTAYRLIRKHKTVERLIRAVQFDGKMKVPPGYLDAFNRAEATFLYQWVYCPKAKGLVNFSEPLDGVNLDDFPCIGKFVDADAATGVAKGDLHPHTKKPIVLPSHFRSSSRAPLRATAIVSTPELKKHKSIESFFKPSRTPLAELDPNSFTPSPSQQQLLQRSPASWSAEPIIRRPLLARYHSSVPSSAPQRVLRASSDMPPPSSLSPKRQRLCSDGNYATPLAKNARISSGTSRFFGSTPTSSNGRRKSTGKGAMNEFNLWSDDSVEEAMSQLSEDGKLSSKSQPVQNGRSPPVSQLPETAKPRTKPSKRLSVFIDDEVEESGSTQASTHSSPTPPATQSTAVAEGTSQEEPLQDELSLSGETLFSSGLAANVELLRFRCSADKSEQHRPQPFNPLKRPAIQIPDFPEHVGTKPNILAVPCSSPVEMNETRGTSHGSAREQESLMPGETFDEADWQAAESQPLDKVPSFDSCTRRSFATKQTVVRGSEDLLVPDSEGEDDSPQHSTGFSFDLARFAFTG